MNQITASLAAETPRWFTDRAAKVEPLHEFVTRGVRTWMIMLLAAVSFVLLIACVNLANLMLVRATARTRELGIRAALGGSRWDLSRVLLLESLILSLTGAALGAAVAWWGVDILRSIIPAEVPRAATIAVDLRVLATTGILAVRDGCRVRHGAGREVLASDRRRCAQSGRALEHSESSHQDSSVNPRGRGGRARRRAPRRIGTVPGKLRSSDECRSRSSIVTMS